MPFAGHFVNRWQNKALLLVDASQAWKPSSTATITDDKGNSFYLIKLRTGKSYLGSAKHSLLIIPGMVASVYIITGKKSVLSSLLKPMLRARSEALRER